MADDNTQNSADPNSSLVSGISVTAKDSATTEVFVPEWLRKAQALENHEERGAALSENGPVVEGLQSTVLPSAQIGDMLVPEEEKSFDPAIPLQLDANSFPEEKAVVVQDANFLEGDAPIPTWLKKASEKTPEPDVTPEIFSEVRPVSDTEVTIEPLSEPTSLPVAKFESEKKAELDDVAAIAPTPTLFVAPTPASAIDPISAPTSAISPAPSSVSTPAPTPIPAPTPQDTTVQPPTSVSQQKRSLMDFFRKSVAPVAETAKTAAQKGLSMVEQGKSAGSPVLVNSANPVPVLKPKNEKVSPEEKKKIVEAEKIYQQGLATIRDLIAPSSMEIRYDMLRVEGFYAQTFFVYTYPRYLDINWLSPIVNFDVTMDISQFIYPIDSAAIMSILKKKVGQMQSSVRIAAEKGIVRDPALETALEDAEELRTQIQRGQEKFFQFALYFTIYSEDEKKLQKISKQLESLLGGKLILTKKSELQMEHGFNSTLPMGLDELEVTRNMNTSPLSTTFPFSSADLTSDEGILYGLNRHNDSLIIFDRFSLENANSVVFAKSGAGKSYGVKLEILRSLMLGTDVIVIDPENEYKSLCQTVGGSYLSVSLTSDRRINPFDLPRPLRDEELQPGDLLRSNIINLHGLLKIMLGGVTPSEEGILDKALNDVYAIKGITMDMVDPSELVPPTMEDLYDILSTMEGGTSLAQRLQKFTQGTYAGIFNKPTNVDMNSGLMVFSIRDLEDGLRPIAMYIILNFIWNRVRSELKKRLLIIDEAWTLMQYEDSGRFLFGLVKRARKYYLGITTITQDVEDFIKSPYGKPVITNSSMQLLLKQAPSAIEILSKVFNLTEGEKYMLLNSGVGQGLFFAGLKHVAIQIIGSYSEDRIVTTNPEEILKSNSEGEQYTSN